MITGGARDENVTYDTTGAAETTDLLVIGGGINGAGVARDAAGRGLKVTLCEAGDLANHTSSASTKLIHGGLRYLEQYDFRLVRHSLMEREVLLRSAPHIIWPLRFVLPHHRDLRPRWMIRIGLFIYDHLGGRKLLPASRQIVLREHVGGEALKPTFTHAFEYSDCWVQDARLVVLVARDAARHGARILTRTKCVAIERRAEDWLVTVVDQHNGASRQIAARVLVNASGPWVVETLDQIRNHASFSHGVRLVKGSHIVVPKLFDHAYPYIFQNADGRILFAIPYERDYTLLGTTDVEVHDDPAGITIDDAEVDYICRAVSEYFRKPVSPGDVVWSYSGVRPLSDDESRQASKVSRDYELLLDDDGPPILSIFGGKITTFRVLAEQVVDKLRQPLGFSSPAWTAQGTLPGGDIPNADYTAFLARCRRDYPWLETCVVEDYARNYGTEIRQLLDGCTRMVDLGEAFGGGLYEREVAYLIRHEWAETTDDILWRRSKKGLRIDAEGIVRLQRRLTAGDAARTDRPGKQP